MAALGVWGMAHVFDGKVYFTRDHTQGNFIPRNLKLPDPNQPLNLGQRLVYDCKKGFQAKHL